MYFTIKKEKKVSTWLEKILPDKEVDEVLLFTFCIMFW
jgi:hypothetical protein